MRAFRDFIFRGTAADRVLIPHAIAGIPQTGEVVDYVRRGNVRIKYTPGTQTVPVLPGIALQLSPQIISDRHELDNPKAGTELELIVEESRDKLQSPESWYFEVCREHNFLMAPSTVPLLTSIWPASESVLFRVTEYEDSGRPPFLRYETIFSPEKARVAIWSSADVLERVIDMHHNPIR